MATRIVGVLAAFAGAICALQVTVGGVGAQDPVIYRKPASASSDTFRLLPPVNENVAVFEYLMQMGQISAELEKIQRLFEREVSGERLTIMRNLPSTLQGLQQNAQDRLFHIKIMCSASQAPRTAWLGIGVSESNVMVSRNVATQLHYPRVSNVEPRSPAAAAGLEPGDEIRKVDGMDLRGRQLEEFVKVPGKKLALTIERDGTAKTLHAVLDSGRARVPEACEVATSSPMVRILIQRDSTVARKARINPMDSRDTLPFKGVATIRSSIREAHDVTVPAPGSVFVAMNHGVMSSYDLMNVFGAYFSSANVSRAADAAGTRTGVRVLHVLVNSQADQGGLKREDIVRSVNKKTVASMAEFKEALTLIEKLNRARVDMEVVRDEKIVPLIIPR